MNGAEPGRLRVSMIYLRPGFAFERALLLPAPATVGEAIEASDIRTQVPELDRAELQVGVFGERRSLDDPLRDGDRVEVYRPLTIGPKEARRLRAAVRRRRCAQSAPA